MPQLLNSHARQLPNKTRRTLLKAGIAGGVVLVLARWMVTSYSPRGSAVFAARIGGGSRIGA